MNWRDICFQGTYRNYHYLVEMIPGIGSCAPTVLVLLIEGICAGTQGGRREENEKPAPGLLL